MTCLRLPIVLLCVAGALVAQAAAAPLATGLYGNGGRTLAVVDDPYGPPRVVNLDSGEVHALYADGPAFRIGTGFATRGTGGGSVRFEEGGIRVDGALWRRLPSVERDVRFRSGEAVLAGTLTLPAGAGPHPAVVWVHGSGPTTRAYLPDLQALFLHHGVAVLAYDKRGIGASTGVYPGASPTADAIDVLARDAQAAARFLARQPGIDPRRVGLSGQSQAGGSRRSPRRASRRSASSSSSPARP